MLNLVEEIKTKFAEHDDFFIQEEQFNEVTVYLVGLSTLIDFTNSNLYIRQMAKMSSSITELFTNLSDQLDVDAEQIIKGIVEGRLVLITESNHNVLLDPISHNLTRNIDQPKNESNILGPMDAFVENIDTNLGLLRKWLSSDRLCHSSYQVGELAKRRISMLYIKGKAPTALIEKVDQQLKQIELDIDTIDDLNKHFGQRKFNPVSYLFSTEIPNQAIDSLKKNRVVLFLDNYPYALVFPHLFLDMLSTVNDRNFPYGLSLMIRTLRGLGALATLILPALYVALTSVNPDVLKIDLAFFISESREGIPLTPIIETLTMVVIVDLIIEAIVRLPKSVGPAITMVGGIILGQAMVEAKLVSNLLVIVITAMLIASSAVVGVQNSLYIRALKYHILILASVYGIFGIFAGLTFVCIYLASLTSCGIPYVTFRIEGKGDTK